MKNRIRSGHLPQPPLGEMAEIETGRIGPPPPTQFPTNRIGVMNMANDWYRDDRVALNYAAIEQLPAGTIKALKAGETSLEIGNHIPLFDAAQFNLAMGSINHMFWSLGEQGEFIRYVNDDAIGATAMTNGFKAAWADPSSAINRARFKKIPLTVADIHETFGDMPDAEGRVRILNEILLSPKLQEMAQIASDVLDHKTGQAFDTTFAHLLATTFPEGYADEVLKKPQLAVSALWREARSRGFDGDCDLTGFADYQIPNVLRSMGLIEYAPDLAAKIDAQQLIEANSVDERAIRAASILGLEALAKAQNVGVADVDYWVWEKRKQPTTPFHLTLTTAY